MRLSSRFSVVCVLLCAALRADEKTTKTAILGRWETPGNLLGWLVFRPDGTAESPTFALNWRLLDGKIHLRANWMAPITLGYEVSPQTLILIWPPVDDRKEGMRITYTRAGS